MIISRTPLRVSFVGGGSDLPAFTRQHAGAVLSMSIKKYVYLSMHEYFDKRGCILKYSEIEKPRTTEEIQHRIIRQVFHDLQIDRVDFNSSADVPAGTGMGSSSAFTVGLLNLCYAYRGEFVSRAKLAELACEIEIEKLGEPIGKQDQYGCALGGVNFLEFHTDGTVSHESVPLAAEQRRRMEQGLMLFYLGGTRSASNLLAVQSRNIAEDPQVTANLRSMVEQAHRLRADLAADVDNLGHYLHDGWLRKKALSAGVSNNVVEGAYAKALSAGATGGKLLGAGGSGFLLVYAPQDTRGEVIDALSDYQLHSVQLDTSGSSIIYSD